MNFLQRIDKTIDGTGTLLNRIIAFLTGLFLTAIFFLLMLRLAANWGVFLALALSFWLNVWLKKRFRKNSLINTFNNGILTFNIITIVGGALLITIFFSVLQGMLN